MEKLKKWSLIAEIFAALAVVFSIAYLALEVQQNTRAIQAQTSQGLLEMINENSLEIAANEKLAALWLDGIEDFDSLNPIRKFQFREQLFAYFNVWEHSFYSQSNLALGLWEAYDDSYKTIYCLETPRGLWVEIGPFFGQEFQDHVNAISEEECALAPVY